MKKLGILVVSFLLLVPSVFAAEQAQPAQADTTITITIAGKTITTLSMADQPEGAQVSISSDSGTVYDEAKGTTTSTGRCTVEVHKGEKRLLQILVEDGVVKVTYRGKRDGR